MRTAKLRHWVEVAFRLKKLILPRRESENGAWCCRRPSRRPSRSSDWKIDLFQLKKIHFLKKGFNVGKMRWRSDVEDNDVEMFPQISRRTDLITVYFILSNWNELNLFGCRTALNWMWKMINDYKWKSEISFDTTRAKYFRAIQIEQIQDENWHFIW